MGGSGAPGSLYIFDSSPTIQNSVIQQSSSAGLFIVTQNTMSAPSILNNQITQNTTQGIYTQATFSLTPVGGLIQGNTILGSGQYGLYLEGAISAAIRDNQIAKGIYFTSRNGSPTLTGNRIMDLGTVITQVPADVIGMLQTQNTLEGITGPTNLYVISDRITGATTLTTLWSGYVVQFGQIDVGGTAGNPATLVVEAGVRIFFGNSSGIRVMDGTTTPGALRVLGTAAAPALFTRLTATQTWTGIALGSGTVGAQTILQHAIIEYGNTSTSPSSASLSITCHSPTLNNVTVRLSSPSGIALFRSSPTMTGVIIDQMAGDGIAISDSGTCSNGAPNSSPIISQALIRNVGRHGVYMNGGSGVAPRVENSIIQTPGGYGVYIDNAQPSILNNTIDGSFFMNNQNTRPTVTGNTIRNFNTKTGRVSVPILQQFQTQNTLLDIGPTTVLELTGNPTVTTSTTIGDLWKTFHVVAGGINVQGTPTAVLTIKPGVIMRFATSSDINIGPSATGTGILVARGTATEPILLTTLSPAPNNWPGIYFGNRSVPGASVLEHVTIDQAGRISAAVRGVGAEFTMRHCTVRNSTGNGVQLFSSSLTMQYCRVHNNAQSGLLVDFPGGFSDNSRVKVANSDFFANVQAAMTNNQTTANGRIALVDARNNWWGDASGPGGSGGGSGNAISTQVLYDPWLGTAFTHPFAITDAYPSSAAFTPSGGETTLTGDVTQTGNWTVEITDSASTVLRSAAGAGRLINVPWDGTNTSGTPQPNGTYNYRIDASGTGSAAPIIGRLQLNGALPIAKIAQPVPNQLILTPTVNIVGSAAASDFTSYSVDLGLGTAPLQFISVRSGVTVPVTNGALAIWTIQQNPPTSTYQIRLRVTGVGGMAEATRYVRIDHTPPLPPVVMQPASPSSTQPITVTGTAEGNATVDVYVNDALAGQTTASGAGAFSLNGVALTVGTNNLKARATDAATNVGGFSSKKSVLYLPPGENLIEILSPADGSTVYK